MVQSSRCKENTKQGCTLRVRLEIFLSTDAYSLDIPVVVRITNSLWHDEKDSDNHDVRHYFSQIGIV